MQNRRSLARRGGLSELGRFEVDQSRRHWTGERHNRRSSSPAAESRLIVAAAGFMVLLDAPRITRLGVCVALTTCGN